jgi:hypothetical protein
MCKVMSAKVLRVHQPELAIAIGSIEGDDYPTQILTQARALGAEF